MLQLDTHAVVHVVAGIAVLGAAVLPRVLAQRALSLPILYVALGWLVFSLPLGFQLPDPLEDSELTEYLTEIGVIVALMGAGLKLDRKIGWRAWAGTWRLLAITMPLTIAAVALLGWWGLGLAPAAALLAGAVLAPTDPVLASEVQVGPPQEDQEDEVRFALTSEAGLNDGLAFPFTNAAVAMAVAGAAPGVWIGEWLAVDVVYRIVVGVGGGVLVGRVLAYAVFGATRSNRFAEYAEGFIALAATLLAYGLTEAVGGYGFIAVFVAALTIRGYEREHSYHQVLHRFSEQTEQLLTAVLLVLFGGALSNGLLDPLGWRGAVAALVVVVIIRPLTGLLAVRRLPWSVRERFAVAFFGIRGIGTFYYLAYALNRADFDRADLVWAFAAAVVLCSIVLHGLTATPAMRRLDRDRGPVPAR